MLPVVVFLAGCTVFDVQPINSGIELKHAVILQNPDVKVSDFVSVLENGFERHGINTKVYSNEPSSLPEDTCVVTYTALRSWDFVTYMKHAEVVVRKDHKRIGYGIFHLRGDGGLSFFKWRGTRAKINPLIDQLLQNHTQ